MQSTLLIASLSLVTLTGFSPAATAQQDPVQTRLGANWRVERHPTTQTPRAIYGPGLRVSDSSVTTVEAARDHATSLLAEHKDLLGLETSTLKERLAIKLSRVWVLIYDQQFHGLPVLGGRADVRLNENGVVAMFGAIAVPIDKNFSVQPVISAEFATGLARQQQGLADLSEAILGTSPQPRLVIWTDLDRAPAVPRLAFEVQIDEENPLRVGRAYIDARSGAHLKFRNDVLRCNHFVKAAKAEGSPASSRLESAIALRREMVKPNVLSGQVMGWVTLGQSPLGPTTNVPLAGVLMTASGIKESIYTDVDGFFDIPYSGTAALSVSVDLQGQRIGRITPLAGSKVAQTVSVTPGTLAKFQLGQKSPSEFTRSQTDAYYHVNSVNEWVRTLLPRSASLDLIDKMRIDVNDQSFACNAAYSKRKMFMFAAGNSSAGFCNNSAFSEVLHHEWGHGLDDMFGGINGNTTREGLSEGWGDILGIYLNDRPGVGAGFGNSALGRSGVNKVQYSAFACVSVSPHCAGQSFMGFAWRFREELNKTMTRARAVRLSEHLVIPAIAADPATQPGAVLEIFILDDDDGSLNNGTPHYTQLEAAAKNHSIPYPQRLGTLTHSSLSSTDRPLTPRIVRAVITAQTGKITSAKLFVAGGATVAMVATKKTDEYIALLPGVPAGNAVSYWLEATLATGKVLRHPPAGALTYQVTEPKPLDISYEIRPAQAAIGTKMTLTASGVASKPLALLFGTSAGPTVIPGFPRLEVGGVLVTASSQFDSQGKFTASLPIPNTPTVVGLMLYSQILSFDAASKPIASNPNLLLAY